MQRNVHTTAATPLARLAKAIESIANKVKKHEDILSREALRAKGYTLEYRTSPTPGLYLVNYRDNDPNYGTATLLGP